MEYNMNLYTHQHQNSHNVYGVVARRKDGAIPPKQIFSCRKIVRQSSCQKILISKCKIGD